MDSATLIAHGSAFLNIHDLIRDWHAYLREKGQSIPDGYFAYRRAVLARQDLEFVELTSKDADELLQLSDRVIAQLDNPDVLRNNTREMFVDCLANGTVYGVLRYKPKQSLQLGLEYLYWKTVYKERSAGVANRFNMHLSVFF